MELQATKQINIDVSKHKYISLDAKQYDRNLRFVLITCYRDGSLLPINKNTCFASIRYRKPDEYGVFNSCEITSDGKILIELTEQMLAVSGTCYADVVIHENVNLSVNIVENDDNTVEIIDTGNSGIISTMTFVVYVHEAAFDNMEIESSYEYNALNDLLNGVRRNYTNVMNSCNTSESNAKTSEINAKKSESNAKTSETNAKTSETNAKTSEVNAYNSETNAKNSEDNAKVSETNAFNSETNAKNSEDKAKTSEANAGISEANAKVSEANAGTSESNAKASETAAKTSEENAKASEENAEEYRTLSQSYAVGGTNTRTNEDVDNAKYYYEQSLTNAKSANGSALSANDSADLAAASESATKGYSTIAQDSMNSAISSATSAYESATNAYGYYVQTEAITNGLNGAFLPMGTIEFSELATLAENNAVASGYLYNISDNFITDDSFRMGAGVEYEAGTNVYYTANGQWDCLAGATVVGVKGVNESIYRKGNVELTAENVGAVASSNIATVDEVKNYLGI